MFYLVGVLSGRHRLRHFGGDFVRHWYFPSLRELRIFVVYKDASFSGLGVVLMQRGHMITYSLRQLKPHKAKCPTHFLELG